MVEKRKSVEPLDGGYGNYISTLDEIRKHVDQTPMLTEDDLKHWYWANHRTGGRAKGPVHEPSTPAAVSTTRQRHTLTFCSDAVSWNRSKIALREYGVISQWERIRVRRLSRR